MLDYFQNLRFSSIRFLSAFTVTNLLVPFLAELAYDLPHQITSNIMKLSHALFTLMTFSKASYACVHAWGGVVGANALDYAFLEDNGTRFCDSQVHGYGIRDPLISDPSTLNHVFRWRKMLIALYSWYIDQDGHFSIRCTDDRIYAFTQDGTTAWYGYPGFSGSFQQNPWVVDHTTFDWNVKEWGC
jgi:hypothetical protein